MTTGDPFARASREELQALRRGAAVGAAPPAERLDLAGPDARRFLHGYVTCDVKGLASGAAARGFVTGLKGQVLADFDLVAGDDALYLRLPAGRGEAVRQHLARYQLADRFELAAVRPLARLLLRGPGAPGVLAAAGLPAPAPGRHLAAEAATVLRADRPGEPRFELWSAAGETAALAARLAGAGATPVGAGAFETARIEDGEPACGVDYGEEALPQETGDEAAISYTKGCYLGQEIVARIHYRGGVQRQPRGLRFAGALPARGSELLCDGRPAGTVTSLADSPECGPIGLALLHRRVGEPPATLSLADGTPVEMVALPFTAIGGDA